MIVGTTVLVRDEYTIQADFDDVGFMFHSGSRGTVIKDEGLNYLIAFKINKTISVLARVSKDAVRSV